MIDETPTITPHTKNNLDVYGKISVEEVKAVMLDTKKYTANGFDHIKL